MIEGIMTLILLIAITCLTQGWDVMTGVGIAIGIIAMIWLLNFAVAYFTTKTRAK